MSWEDESRAAMIHRCPICKAPTDSSSHPEFPFCSDRCRTLDLGNWAAERYVISETVIDESVPEKPDPNETEH